MRVRRESGVGDIHNVLAVSGSLKHILALIVGAFGMVEKASNLNLHLLRHDDKSFFV